MREAYNECVPLLTAYSSELGQNAALQAAYAHVLKHEGAALDPAQRKAGGKRAARFPAGRSRSAGRPARPATARWRSGWRSWRPSFPRTCSMPAAPTRAALPMARSSPDCPANAVDRAAADAREANQPGWLFKLDQPTYMTVMASAESEQLRRDIYEAWVTRASELGPSAGRFDNNPHHRRDPAAAPRTRPTAGIRQLRRLRARDPHGEEQQASAGVPRRSGAALPAGGARRNSRISRSLPAASSTPGTWRTTASGCRRAASRSRRRRCARTSRCRRYSMACSL